MTLDELQRVRDWADEKVTQGGDPPWAWYNYMKLRESLDAILSGKRATAPVIVPEVSPEEAKHQGIAHLRLVDNSQQGNVLRDPSPDEIPLPM